MPGDNDSGKLLRGGEFYSPLQGRLRTDDVLLSELRQPCSRKVPRHEHELAYFTVVLDGDYLEGDRQLAELTPFTAAFNPAGVAHSTVIGPAGAAFFTVELRSEHLRQLEMKLPDKTLFDRGAGAMLWPGLRLYSAFKARTADPVIVEGHVLELLGAIVEVRPAERGSPRWLERVKERLQEEFRGELRMRELARDAGVHPVHLARVFRARENQTPGDYLQRVRVRAACQLLHHPERPLAAIAAECGFADQSHLTRVFRKIVGLAPGEFRRRMTLRSARG
jgi:AraC family transcriptional regulator